MKKMIMAVVLSLVMLGSSVMNVSAVATNVCWHEQLSVSIENKISTYCHAIDSINPDGSMTLIGCDVVTITRVRVTRCADCLAVKSEKVLGSTTTHKYTHN